MKKIRTRSTHTLTTKKQQWVNTAINNSPELPEMRERLLPISDGNSFSQMYFTQSFQETTCTNRYQILEIISRHLKSIGLYYTAEVLSKETGLEFADPERKSYENSDLRMIVSLGYNSRDSVWEYPHEQFHTFFPEYLEEDFNASHYKEDPSTIFIEFFNPQANTVYLNTFSFEYDNLKASSLKRAIVALVMNPISADSLNRFFLSLHSVTSSLHFFEHLMALFYIDSNPNLKIPIESSTLLKIRTNVLNLVKKWIMFHGLFIGKRTLKSIEIFLTNLSKGEGEFAKFAKMASSIVELIPLLPYGMVSGIPTRTPADPIIPEPRVIFDPNLTILSPEPAEVARQITLIAYDVFASVHSLEFVTAIAESGLSFRTPTLNEFAKFELIIENVVMDAILNSSNFMSAYLRVLNLAEELLKIANLASASSILKVLQRDKVREICKSKNIDLADLLEKAGVPPGEQYQQTIREQFDQWKPTLPNIEAELALAPRVGKEAFVNGLVDWERVRLLANRPLVLYRLQNTKFNFVPVPQIQKVIDRAAQLSSRKLERQLARVVDEMRNDVNC